MYYPDETPKRKERWRKLKHLHDKFDCTTVAAIAGLDRQEVRKWHDEDLSNLSTVIGDKQG